MSDLRYWIGFNRVGGIGPAKLRALLEVARALESSLSTDEILGAVVDAAIAISPMAGRSRMWSAPLRPVIRRSGN